MESQAWVEKSRLFAKKLPDAMKARWQTIEQIGLPQPYEKTHNFDGDFINSTHSKIGSAPLGRMGIPICIDLGIDGYLQRQEALKLYELAFFCRGDALELGTHKGLSASIIAKGLNDGGGGHLETVDIDAEANRFAKANVTFQKVTFTLKHATTRLDELITEGRRVGFMFVDHWHGYKETHEAAERAPRLLSPGGFVLFHDFLDPGNKEPDHPYGVYQAVLDAYADDSRMQFGGLFGSTALFQSA